MSRLSFDPTYHGYNAALERGGTVATRVNIGDPRATTVYTSQPVETYNDGDHRVKYFELLIEAHNNEHRHHHGLEIGLHTASPSEMQRACEHVQSDSHTIHKRELAEIPGYKSFLVSPSGRVHTSNADPLGRHGPEAERFEKEYTIASDQPRGFWKNGDTIGISICSHGILTVYKNRQVVKPGLYNSQGKSTLNKKFFFGRMDGFKADIQAHFDREWYGIASPLFSTERVSISNYEHTTGGKPFFACCDGSVRLNPLRNQFDTHCGSNVRLSCSKYDERDIAERVSGEADAVVWGGEALPIYDVRGHKVRYFQLKILDYDGIDITDDTKVEDIPAGFEFGMGCVPNLKAISMEEFIYLFKVFPNEHIWLVTRSGRLRCSYMSPGLLSRTAPDGTKTPALMCPDVNVCFKEGDMIGFSMCEHGVIQFYINGQVIGEGVRGQSKWGNDHKPYSGRFDELKGVVKNTFRKRWYGIANLAHLLNKAQFVSFDPDNVVPGDPVPVIQCCPEAQDGTITGMEVDGRDFESDFAVEFAERKGKRARISRSVYNRVDTVSRFSEKEQGNRSNDEYYAESIVYSRRPMPCYTSNGHRIKYFQMKLIEFNPWKEDDELQDGFEFGLAQVANPDALDMNAVAWKIAVPDREQILMITRSGRLRTTYLNKGLLSRENGDQALMIADPNVMLKQGDVVGISICERGIICVYLNGKIVEPGVREHRGLYGSKGRPYSGRYTELTDMIRDKFDRTWYGLLNVCYALKSAQLYKHNPFETPIAGFPVPQFTCCGGDGSCVNIDD